MFKIVTTVAIATLMTSSAFAAGVKLTGGQFVGVTQYTALLDPSSICKNLAGLAAGQLTDSVATVAGLGKTWTSTIANTNPVPGSPAGTGWINCQFPALPAATSFVAQTIGTAPATAVQYVATPSDVEATNCFASNGVPYTLSSSNSTLTNGTVQTNTITVLPVNGTGKDYGYRLTTTNTSVAVGGNVLCYLSTDAVYANASK